MTEIAIADLDLKKISVLYATAIDRCKPKQRGFVENFLNNPETAGDVKNAGIAGGFTEGSTNSLYELVPKPELSVLSVDIESMHPVTLAILLGLRMKAETLKRIEERKADQRVKLGITPDWVLKHLKAIAIRAAGYTFDEKTLDAVPESFDKKNFAPAAAQRTFEALGREMGMFFDRGPGEKAKTLDEMDERELDEAIAGYDRRIRELEALRRDEGEK